MTTETTTTWTDLLQAEPGLTRFEAEAIEAGKNGADWWPNWVATSREFKRIMLPHSRAAKETVLDHLKTVFRRAQKKALQKQKTPQKHAAVIRGLTGKPAANEGA